MESINALPTYKFKLGQSRNGNANLQEHPGASEGGILAAGTEKERVISGEDAVSFGFTNPSGFILLSNLIHCITYPTYDVQMVEW